MQQASDDPPLELPQPPAVQLDSAALIAAAIDFRKRELAFLHGLSVESKKALVPSWPGPSEPFPAHHLLLSGELALVLLGVKPCAVFGNGRWPGLGPALWEAVLVPWAVAHAVVGRWFRLERIASAVVPSEVPGHPGFFGWPILLDTRDAVGCARAVSVLLGGDAVVQNAAVGAALGYPGSEGTATAASVYYMAANDEAYRDPAFPAEPICCVPLVEYRAGRSDAAAVGAHFRRAADAVAAAPGLGLALELDLQACSGWGPAGLAALCTAAWGGKAALLAAIDARQLRMWPWMASGALQAAARLMPE